MSEEPKASPPAPTNKPASPATGTGGSLFAGPFLPTWVILLSLLLLFIILGAIVGGIRSYLRKGPEGGTAEVTVEKVLTFASPLPLPPQPLLEAGGEPVEAAIPTAVTVGDLTWPVVAAPIQGGKWPIPEKEEEAVWLYGTVVNYIIGIPYDEATAERLAGLDPSDLITLTLNNGHQLVFGMPQSRRIEMDEVGPLAQDHPGLTLALLLEAESERRLIVQARYLPDLIGASATQRVDDVEVTFVALDSPEEELDVEGRPLVVIYRLHNGNEAALDPAYFDLRLQDGEGRYYLLNPQVTARSTATETALIQPGETVTLTAGYLVLRDAPPPLTWLFRLDPVRSPELRFDLPYRPLPPEPARPRVELLSAFVDGQRHLIVVNGVVHNDGEAAMTVSMEDIHLTSSKGEGTLHAANPLLPWTIGGGDEQRFELQFARPEDVSSVLVEILGFTFQLNGLP